MNDSALPDWAVINVDGIDNFKDYLLPEDDIGKLKAAPSLNSSVTDYLLGDSDSGSYLPWTKTHGDFALRHSEVSVVAGMNGSGKSVWVSEVAINLLREAYCNGNKNKVLMISPEMSPAQNMARAVRQILAKPEAGITDQDIGAALSWLGNKYYIYDHLGSVAPDVLLGLIRYSAAELGVTHVFIDNLTILKLTNSSADVNLTSKDFIADLVSISRETQTHCVLVAHTRKPPNGIHDRQDKYSVRGASEITDLVDNVWGISRSFLREEKLNYLDPMGDRDEYVEWLNKPSAFMEIQKQRHGSGALKRYSLYYDIPSMRFMPKPQMLPATYEEIAQLHQSIGGETSLGYSER